MGKAVQHHPNYPSSVLFPWDHGRRATFPVSSHSYKETLYAARMRIIISQRNPNRLQTLLFLPRSHCIDFWRHTYPSFILLINPLPLLPHLIYLNISQARLTVGSLRHPLCAWPGQSPPCQGSTHHCLSIKSQPSLVCSAPILHQVTSAFIHLHRKSATSSYCFVLSAVKQRGLTSHLFSRPHLTNFSQP